MQLFFINFFAFVSIAKAKKLDKWLNKVLSYTSKRIQTFVAFMFLLLSIGMVIGYIVAMHTGKEKALYLTIPPLLGLTAYYNRDLAVALFVLFILFVFVFI